MIPVRPASVPVATHDTILFYTKSSDYLWNKVFTEYDPAYVARYKHVDHDGRRWADDNLTAPGIRHGDSGATWRGFNPTEKGNHWKVSHNTVVELIGQTRAEKLSTTEMLDVLDQHGLIHWPRNDGFPRFKRMLGKGLLQQDLVLDIPPPNSRAQERLGYPTQKPVALLERIISASSDENDVVLDPFCGCGTTVHAAQKLRRRWIGIDITHLAIGLIERRLQDAFPGVRFEIHGTPKDFAGAEDLARRDKFQFQWFRRNLAGDRSLGEQVPRPQRASLRLARPDDDGGVAQAAPRRRGSCDARGRRILAGLPHGDPAAGARICVVTRR
jgi:DNA methylase